MNPTFETNRIQVRPRTLADLEECLSMDRDPEVTKFIPGPWADPVKHRAFVIERMNTDYPDGLGYWSIIDLLDKNSFLGWVFLVPCDSHTKDAEIGWRLNRKSWGKGYGTEASALIVQHAFESMDLESIIAEIDPSNAGSIAVAKKLKMEFVEEKSTDGESVEIYRLNRPPF